MIQVTDLVRNELKQVFERLHYEVYPKESLVNLGFHVKDNDVVFSVSGRMFAENLPDAFLSLGKEPDRYVPIEIYMSPNSTDAEGCVKVVSHMGLYFFSPRYELKE